MTLLWPLDQWSQETCQGRRGIHLSPHPHPSKSSVKTIIVPRITQMIEFFCSLQFVRKTQLCHVDGYQSTHLDGPPWSSGRNRKAPRSGVALEMSTGWNITLSGWWKITKNTRTRTIMEGLCLWPRISVSVGRAKSSLWLPTLIGYHWLKRGTHTLCSTVHFLWLQIAHPD